MNFLMTLIYFLFFLKFASSTHYQEMARLDYFNPKYIGACEVFTSRKNRNTPYLTNCTCTNLQPWGNNVTLKITIANMNNEADSHAFHVGTCSLLKWPWVADWLRIYSDIQMEKCPVPAKTNHFFNVELPPKNMPFIMKNVDYKGSLEAYVEKNKDMIFVFSMALRHKKNGRRSEKKN